MDKVMELSKMKLAVSVPIVVAWETAVVRPDWPLILDATLLRGQNHLKSKSYMLSYILMQESKKHSIASTCRCSISTER